MINNFVNLTCDGAHTHDVCQGSDTLRSGFYNEYMSKLIVDGLINPNSTVKLIKPSKINITPSTPVKINPSLNIETYINEATPDSEEFPEKQNSTSKVIDALNRQVTKAIKRASAKLENLNVSAEGLKQKLNQMKSTTSLTTNCRKTALI